MGKITRRGALAASAAIAVALGGAVGASADVDGSPIDIDHDPENVERLTGPAIYRFADEDRVGTALQAARLTNLPWGNTAIIATSEDFSDALAAAPLADLIDAPVLLNKSSSALRGDVLNYLKDNGFDEVILVGGTDVFGNSVRTQIETAGLTVDRVEGANRFQTALQLAERAVAQGGEAYETTNVFLADGRNFPDALAAGAAAAENDGVVLLTNGSDRIDAYTYQALTAGSFQTHESIIAIGGPAAAAAEAGYQGDPIEVNHEVIGENRYETATLTAEEYVGDAANFVVASGENYPDAVVGGAYAANVDGALLLTKQDSLTNVTADYLESIRLDVDNVFVFGGPASVAPSVSVEIDNLDWRY